MAGRRDTKGRSEGWRPIAAAFAVFALLIHVFMPMAAVAAPSADEPTVICTLHGAQTLPGQPPAKGTPANSCQQCCLAVAAVDLAPPAADLAAPLAYERLDPRPAPQVRLALARAPPRPPGQGPPTA